jgi:DNA-binding transcriptional ArsR family regulator
MARPRDPSDSLRHPLDEILGTRSGVRILRLLADEVDAPLGATEVARRVGLTAAAARGSLEHLARTGFVTRVGGGRKVQYQVREDEPILEALRGVFREERRRYDAFLQQLRDVFERAPEVLSAWMDSAPVAVGTAVQLSVVAETESIPWIREELRTALVPLERRFDQVIEMAVYSRADAPAPTLDSILPLAGTFSLEWPPGRTIAATHSEIDDRSLRMSRGIAKLLRQDPSMTKRAIRHVERLLQEDQGPATRDLAEWKQVLETYSAERLSGFLASESSRAGRLRQSSPFFAVLTSDERDELLALLEAQK